MSVAIRALNRGGYSVRGGTFEPRRNAVVLQALSGEVTDISVTYGEDIASVTKALYGLDATDATIDGAAFAATINGVKAGGYLEYTATLDSGAVRKLRIEASTTFGSSFDYGSAVQTETEEALILE